VEGWSRAPVSASCGTASVAGVVSQHGSVLRTPHAELVSLDKDTAAAIARGDRTGRAWAKDFPTEADVFIARRTAEAVEDPGPDPVAEPWRSPWLVRHEGHVVGMLGCKGAPAGGAVEIGYGLAPSAQGQGVATEAVRALVAALARSGVGTVNAETLVDNHASRRVLEKAGFIVTGRRTSDEGELITWRRTSPAP
jgi:RimJ/RimL family protein N-acetyltransferase